MADLRSLLKDRINQLKQQRDEIALKIHLGKEDAKDEWDKVKARLDKLNDDFEPVKDAVGESAENVMESMKLVAEELKESFSRIRKSVQS